MKDKIQQLQQNSIALKIARKEKYKLCGTRFGGKPDVPSNFVWPYFEGKGLDGTVANRPLTFLAQFNCEDLSKYDTEHLLPEHGILSFFYETDSQCWALTQRIKDAPVFSGLRTHRSCRQQSFRKIWKMISNFQW
mgnify:CR=1 FL=1